MIGRLRSKLLRTIVGWTLLLVGIAGLFLPFLQGILMIAAGLAILARDHAWAARWLTKLRERIARMRTARGPASTIAEAQRHQAR